MRNRSRWSKPRSRGSGRTTAGCRRARCRLLFSLLVTKTSLAGDAGLADGLRRPPSRCRTSARCRCAGSRSPAPSVVASTVSSGLIWKTPKPSCGISTPLLRAMVGTEMATGDSSRDRGGARDDGARGLPREAATPPLDTPRPRFRPAERRAGTGRRSSGAPRQREQRRPAAAASAGTAKAASRSPGVHGRSGQRRAGGHAEGQAGDRPGQRLGEHPGRDPGLHQRHAGHQHRRDRQPGEEPAADQHRQRAHAPQQLRRERRRHRGSRRSGRRACPAAGRRRTTSPATRLPAAKTASASPASAGAPSASAKPTTTTSMAPKTRADREVGDHDDEQRRRQDRQPAPAGAVGVDGVHAAARCRRWRGQPEPADRRR